MGNYEIFMREAIALAEQGRWMTAPNPCVGAVLVRDGEIVARGYHHACGQDHAEIDCLKDAAKRNVDVSACTLVVTLEPCNHFGKTPPCSEAIIAAGIKHVVIGMSDPNPVASGGAARLREAGILVETGVLEADCRELIADFLTWTIKKRPFVILKMACSIDGRLGPHKGGTYQISGEGSRATVMELREKVGLAGGAVLVGGNTFWLDNPQLTARTPTAQKQPYAVIASSKLPAPDAAYHIIQDRPQQAVFFCSAAQAASPAAHALRSIGVSVYGVSQATGAKGVNLAVALDTLYAEKKCPYILCEGGARLGLSLLEQNVADEVVLHMAPILFGDASAKPLFEGRSVDTMAEVLPMKMIRTQIVDGDCHIYFRPVH